jgi:hypothetical protein
LFDQKYFKDRNLSSFEFYRNFSYAPGGWFAKYDYATGTFATKENSNELDKSNLFYFLLRPYVYELLLSEMNGLGSSSDLYSVIKTETTNGDSSAIINQKGAIAFKKFNKEMGTQFKGGLIQSKYYAAQLQTTLNFFDAMVSVIPLIDISGGDPAMIALNNRVLEYKNKVTVYQNRTDLFAAKLDVYENPEDYNTLYNYFVESEDALFDMDSLI